MYRIHVDTVSEEEVAHVGVVAVGVFRLQRGESLQHVESRVLLALGDEGQAQVHGIYGKNNKY